MDKKICKYELGIIFKSIIIYYIFFIGIVAFLGGVSSNDGVSEITFQGLNLATMIFLLVSALCIVKPSFYFAQGNNVSRKNFIKGTIEAGAILSIILAFIDTILIKILGMFFHCINIYELAFGNIESSEALDVIINIFLMYLFSVLLYFIVYLIFLIISTIYFKLNTTLKIVWSVASIFILTSSISVMSNIVDISGNIINRYSVIIIFIILIAIFILIEVLLGKNIKEGLEKTSLKGLIALIIILVVAILIFSESLFIGGIKKTSTEIIPIESEIQESDNYFPEVYKGDFEVEIEAEIKYGYVFVQILDSSENVLWSKVISKNKSEDIYFEENVELNNINDNCILRVKSEDASGELKYSITQ